MHMRILIVTGEKRTANLLMIACANAGLTPDRAYDVQHALSLACLNHYHLMIFDEVLCGIDGQALVRHFRSIGNSTPAVLLADSEIALDQALAAGADDVLAKSSTPDELRHRLQALLRTFTWCPQFNAGATVGVRSGADRRATNRIRTIP
jgi:two-component system OmpR family response regulator